MYGSVPPLPFDVGSLELFYPHLLPTVHELCPREKGIPAKPILECDAVTCAEWMNGPLPTDKDAINKFQRGRSFILPPQRFPASASEAREPFGWFVLLQDPWQGTRAAFANDTWVEVIRSASLV